MCNHDLWAEIDCVLRSFDRFINSILACKIECKVIMKFVMGW